MKTNTFDKSNNWNKVGWKSPANIALIKYWGKKGNQYPINPSLSFTLKESFTETKLFFKPKVEDNGKIDFEYLYEGEKNIEFSKRIQKFLNQVFIDFPFLTDYQLKIESKNSFPHSTGIASSASSMSALALCLCEMERKISGHDGYFDFFKKASKIARLGSGSAGRSVYGGFNLWGKFPDLLNSSNKFAITYDGEIHENFKNIQNTVLVIDKNPKKVSSSIGHLLMKNHPDKYERISQGKRNLKRLLKVLETGDFIKFSEIVEEEAISIHTLMKNSNPSYSLLKTETMDALAKILNYRMKYSVPLCFTLDAGPNIHLLYPIDVKDKVEKFIHSELKKYCADGEVITDMVGAGPENIYEN